MRTGGFTLIELIVIVAVFGVVSIYVGRILAVNERAYHTIDQTSESQQNLRFLTEMIENDARHAGLMVSPEAALCGVDNDQAPDLLYVSDSGAIDPQNDFEPYPGARVSAVGNLAVGVAQTLQLDTLVLEPAPPNRAAYDLDNDGVADSDFRPNAGVIVADLADPGRGTACGRITAVDVVNDQITVVAETNLGNAVLPTDLVAVPANEFRVAGTQLLWNGRSLANGIEDLQVVWIFDLDDDNVIDVVAEQRGNGVQADYESDEYTARDLRQLRIRLVSRARREDPGFDGQPQTWFNRQPIAANDGYRRRSLETRVRLRNLDTRIGAS